MENKLVLTNKQILAHLHDRNIDKENYLVTELFESIWANEKDGADIVTEAKEKYDDKYTIELTVNGHPAPVALLTRIFDNIDKAIEKQAEAVVMKQKQELLDKLREEESKLEEVFVELRETLIDKYEIKIDEDY